MSTSLDSEKNNNMKKNIVIGLGVLALIVTLYIIYIYSSSSVSYDSSLSVPLSFGSKPPDVSELFNNLCN